MKRLVSLVGVLLVGVVGIMCWPGGAQGQVPTPDVSGPKKGDLFPAPVGFNGKWKLNGVMSLTTCPTKYAGQPIIESWELTYLSGTVYATNGKTGSTYWGEPPTYDGSSYRMVLTRYQEKKDLLKGQVAISDPSEMLELSMTNKDGTNFSGRILQAAPTGKEVYGRQEICASLGLVVAFTKE